MRIERKPILSAPRSVVGALFGSAAMSDLGQLWMQKRPWISRVGQSAPGAFSVRQISPYAKAAKVSLDGSHRCVAFAWRYSCVEPRSNVTEACLAVGAALEWCVANVSGQRSPM